MENIDEAVNKAGVASAGSGDVGSLDFNAKPEVKKNYDSKVEGPEGEVKKVLITPIFEFIPNFQQNFALLDSWHKTGKTDNMFPRGWQTQLGDHTFTYSQYFEEQLEDDGFSRNDILQEEFKEAAKKNELALRAVKKLTKGNYNECVIENGVLYIQTTPEHWTSNCRDPAAGLVDIL